MKMESLFLHSTPVEAEVARQAGVFTTLPARKSKYSDTADKAAQRALRVWQDHAKHDLSKQAFKATNPSISPVGNVFAYCTPEALPERMDVHVYMSEFAIIYDDFCEPLAPGKVASEYDMLGRCYNPDTQAHESESVAESNLRKALSEGLLEMLEIDRSSGLRVLEAYRKWMLDVRGAPRIDSYDQFMDYRQEDFGMTCWWAMHRFVMGLSYTDEEHRLTEHILRTGSELLVLSQDYWSWDKEYLAWKTNGTKIKNAVEFWSRTEGLSFELAREKVKTRILDLEQVYIKQSDQFYKDFPKESVALRPWVESIGACNAGLNYWSACAPRYHDWKKSQDMDSLASSVNFLYNSSIGTHPELVSIPLQDLEDSTNSTLVGSFPRQGQEQIALVQRPSALNDRITEAKSSASRACLAPYWRKPDNMALIAPCNYIAKLPSKGMRSLLITAFNDWIGAPMSSATSIKSIIGLLHDASLLIDDVQDNSNFRRGKPAAHTIFGISQALNSGLFMFSQAVQESRKLSNPESTDIVLQNLECLYLGQSWDLYWKHSLSCPSIDEYMNMVDNKTGGMFRMLAQLLKAESLPAMTVSDRERISTVDLDYLTLLIGRFFQIRDDYMNLQSAEYCEQKGFCEDLDEGKYSFPIVHLLGRKPEYRGYITGVFRQLPLGVGQEARLSREMKQSILEILESEGSLAATLQLLKELEGAIEFEITRMETILGKKNATMRLVIATLSVKHLK